MTISVRYHGISRCSGISHSLFSRGGGGRSETHGDAKLHKEMRRQREKEAKKERKKEGKGKRGKKGAAAEVTSGLLSAEAERRMEENGGLQAAGLIRGVGQGMDGGADVHEEWD